MSNVLEVNNISKSFKDYGRQYKRILSWFGFGFEPVEEHKVLKNINFTIAPGEAVGIVGHNGAGKSTLLKIITGTLKPSEGSLHISGRISAILELGMGFHPDLTGRQNVYHAAGLMGFTREQIDLVIDELEAFAEIGDYFDQPVRTYSSGMQMRVAFGVVTAYRPEILIVDEALSVGDAYFQHKSLNRIREFQEQGTTLLIVSHDRSAIQAMCSRAILLEKGVVIKDGDPEEIMDFYNALIAKKENSKIEQVVQEDAKVKTISGTGEAIVEAIGFYDTEGKIVKFIGVGDPVELRINIKVNKEISKLVIGYMIKDQLGQTIFGETSEAHNIVLNDLKKDEKISIIYDFNMTLGVGTYSVATALTSGKSHIEGNFEWKDLALVFNIVNLKNQEFIGSSWIETKSHVNRGDNSV